MTGPERSNSRGENKPQGPHPLARQLFSSLGMLGQMLAEDELSGPPKSVEEATTRAAKWRDCILYRLGIVAADQEFKASNPEAEAEARRFVELVRADAEAAELATQEAQQVHPTPELGTDTPPPPQPPEA